VEPLLRLLGWALATGIEWTWLGLLAPFSTRRARRARRAAWAERTSERAVQMLGALKGVFVKAGQFAAHRHDIVPAGAGAALARLRDRVPPLPFERLRPILETDLGAPLESLFGAFDAEPLGAASIAQVHRARLHTGEEVAVKVQYPWLASSLAVDLAIVRAGLEIWARLAGPQRLDRRRLFEEFAAGLRDELDFEREAAVAAEIAANLAHDGRIVVPRVVASHSSRRVLTMSFHPAVRITDRAALTRLGVAPREVLEIVARAYAKQVFVDGLFHADPHPGNLFVLEEPGAGERPRVLFVDFGLSRRLDPELRREMRQGLHALIRRDPEAFLAGMDRMGMVAPGAGERVLAAVERMLGRVGDAGGALGVAGSQMLSLKDEAKQLLQETDGLQLPNDLLLFAKTLSYVFSLGHELDPEVDLMRLSLPYLLRFLAEP
jgi:ubiquinone biosynthesis protein